MSFENRIGLDGFVWWLGVIEDRADPLNLCRVRVRIFGWHTDDKQKIATEDLPWALPQFGPNVSNINSVPSEGDYVFGFFLDGKNGQQPAIVGVYPGVPQEFTNAADGFTDARTDQQVAAGPRKPVYSGGTISAGTPARNPTIIGEPSTSRLFRNEKIDKTLIGVRKSSVSSAETADHSSWNEPASKYATVAPFNKVIETESGHVMEFDDTPGAERVSLSHRLGTFEEIHPDASKVTKVVGNNYEIYLSGNNMLVKGTLNITSLGPTNILSGGRTTIRASDMKVECDVDVLGSVHVSGTVAADGAITTKSSVTADGEVTGNGIGLSTHKHPGIFPGPGVTGPSVP